MVFESGNCDFNVGLLTVQHGHFCYNVNSKFLIQMIQKKKYMHQLVLFLQENGSVILQFHKEDQMYTQVSIM